MSTNPKEKIQISWEENVMRIRDQVKLSISHFEEELFSIIDPFFQLTNQMNKQFTIIVKENDRLIALLKKNKIDYIVQPPKPETPKSPPKKEKTHA